MKRGSALLNRAANVKPSAGRSTGPGCGSGRIHEQAPWKLFRFSWKWRRRSTVKIMERTHEKQRKHYTPEEKVAILRRHLLEQVPISELCDKHGLQPAVFYRWQKEFFENGAAAYQPKERPNHAAEQERIDYLEKKIQTKDWSWQS